VLAAASRRKLILLIAFALPVAAALVAAFLVTPKYQANSKVLVLAGHEYQSRAEVPGGNEIGPQTTMLDTINTEIEILTSDDLIRGVLNKETVNKLYPELVTSPPRDISLDDAAVRAFQEDLKVAPVKLSNVMSVSLRSYDPRVATETLSVLLTEFQQRHVEAFRRNRRSLLDGELQVQHSRLAILEQERADYKIASGIHSVDEQRSELLRQRARNLETLLSVAIKQQVLSGQVAFLKRELEIQPPQIVARTTSRESEVAQDNQKRLRDLELQEREMRARYLDNSPVLARLQAALNATRQFIAQTRPTTSVVEAQINPLAQEVRSQLITASAEHVSLAGKSAILRDAVAQDEDLLSKLELGATRLADLDRDIAQLNRASGTLRQRLDDERYLDDLDRANVASLRVIEQPSVMRTPIFPNKRLFLAAGTILGGLASGLMLLISLTFGLRAIVTGTVERVLGVPVVAALPLVPRQQIRRTMMLAGAPITLLADRRR